MLANMVPIRRIVLASLSVEMTVNYFVFIEITTEVKPVYTAILDFFNFYRNIENYFYYLQLLLNMN